MAKGTSYTGLGKVLVGNGTTLLILYTGQSSIATKSRSLIMKSLPLVPKITKNLMSVSKFSKNNQVFFEFYLTYYLVRDLKNKEVLLHENVHNSLYGLHLGSVIKKLLMILLSVMFQVSLFPYMFGILG